MSFSAGSIIAKTKVDSKGFNKGLNVMMKGLGGLAIGVGVVTAGMTKATLTANKWQKSLSNVNTLTDETVVNSQEMAKGLIGLDASLGSTIELTDALYQSFSSGAADLDEAMNTTTESAKFARAAVTDTATAVDVLTTAQNAYGKETVSITQASDVFFTTIKQGKINGEQLASVIGKSIPLFASMGIPLEELGAGMAAMTKQGVNAAESTTQLNGIVNSFLKPSESMTAALEEQGFASGSALLETEGLSGALEFLEIASGGSKDKLAELTPSIEAMRGVLALTGKGGEEFNAILIEMETAAGATDEAFAKQELTFDTLKNQMEKIELLAGNVGKFFVDKIAVGAITAGKGMVDFINSSRGMEIVAQIAEIAGGAFEILRTAITILVEKILPTFSDLWGTVTENLEKFTTESEKGSGASKIFAVAVQLVSAGLAIVGKVVEMAITNVANFVFAIKSSAEAVGSFFDMITGKVKFSDVKESFADAADAFKTIAVGAVEGYTDLFTEVKEQFLGFGEGVKTASIEMTENVIKTSDASRDYVLSNWGEMLTGQTLFYGQTNENQEEQALVEQGYAHRAFTNTTQHIGKLKAAWDAYFKDAAFSWKGLQETMTSAIGFGLSSISALSDQHFKNEGAKQQLAFDKDLAALQKKLDDGIITQEQFDERKDALDAKALRKSNALAKKQFETQKALRIAGVVMDVAASVSGWWSQAPLLGPIAGPIFAGVMSAASVGMGIAQVAMIAGESFVPAREMGGMASGMTRVNESGGEIISLPDGSQVIPNDISQQIANGSSGGSTMINVSFAGAHIDSKMNLQKVAKDVSKILGKELRKAG